MTGKRTHGLAAALLACVTGAAPVAFFAVAGAPAAQAVTAHAGGPAASSAPVASAAASVSVWQPAADTDWMWELGKPLNSANANLMGTGVTAWNGDTAPGDNPALYDIDAIENPASTVTQLHQLGDHAICYIEVGSAGNYYTAAQEGIPATYYAQLKASYGRPRQEAVRLPRVLRQHQRRHGRGRSSSR